MNEQQESNQNPAALNKLDIIPSEIKRQYNQFVARVVAANPQLTGESAFKKILDAEKKYNHVFFGATYSQDPNRQLVFERRRLSSLEELNLLTEAQKKELQRLKADFNSIINAVVDSTGIDKSLIENSIDTLLVNNIASDLLEAKKILIEGPIIKGFEKSNNYPVPNSIVKQFLLKTFGIEALRKTKVGRVTKDDKYMIYRSDSIQDIEEGNELSRMGIASWSLEGHLVSEDQENYLKAEMYLEKITDPQMLRHIYKIRATAGNTEHFHQIKMHSFGVEQSKDYDYLEDAGLVTEEDKMLAYILGTLAHEVAHGMKIKIDEKNIINYAQIMEEEIMPGRTKYVSDYVLRHKEVYGSSQDDLLGEDMAETIRIYVTNPAYLQKNFPRRYAFVKNNLPFIKEGSVIDTVKNIKKQK